MVCGDATKLRDATGWEPVIPLAETLRWLQGRGFPLLGPTSPIEEPRIREAVEWVLGKEKLKLEQLRIPGAERLLYFKHEERPILVHPSKLVLGRTQADELNRGFGKLNVAFTLPPGSYATLVVKRLFHRTAREDTPDEIRATPGGARPAADPASRGRSTRGPTRLPGPRKGPKRGQGGRTGTSEAALECPAANCTGWGAIAQRVRAYELT